MAEKLSKKTFISEFLGTFFLVLLVLVSISEKGYPSTSVFASVSLALLVFVFGPVSGAHFNPAISLGSWLNSAMSTGDMLKYLVAQMLGAKLASVFLIRMGIDSFALKGKSSMEVFVAEVIGVALLALSIAAVRRNKQLSSVAGIVVGLGLYLGIMAASIGSLGILNPAVAWVTGVPSVGYVLGPIVGASIAFKLYEYLQSE